MSNAPTNLRIAIGDYPHTLPLKRGEIVSPWLKLDFVEVKPMHKAFKPMVREHAYDASEMALVTYLQAKAYNKGLRLLPAAMLARFQHGCMLFNAERGKLDPAHLAGHRIGVRAYSQTTGGWLRGILANDYTVDFSSVQWVTFEDGHVAEAKEPPGVIRARADQDMTKMLIDGELDAAIYGVELPNDSRLQSVIPDPEAAARAWIRPGAGQSYGGGYGDAGAREPASRRRTLPALGSGQEGVRPAHRRRDRYRSVRQRDQPALPRAADLLCGSAALAPAPAHNR
jgi:4,5-dihydroxyphthalate decarboxylase